MEFSKQEYWTGLSFHTPGDLPDLAVKPTSFASPKLAGGFLTTMPPVKLQIYPQLFTNTLCNPMDGSKPGFPVHHQLPRLTQTHVHRVSAAIQLSHPLSSPSPPFSSPSPPFSSLSQQQGPFQWVSSSHQVAKVLEFQLQQHSFQWIFRTNFL